MDPLEAEAMRWLAGSLRWELSMDKLRNGPGAEAIEEPAEPEIDVREPVPFRRLPVREVVEETEPGDRVA